MVDRHAVVRDATPADLDATAAIIAADAGGTPAQWRDRFAQILADPDRPFLVVELADGAVAGFGQARHVEHGDADDDRPPRGWYLSGVTVAAHHRRQGLGQLLTHARMTRLALVTSEVFYLAEVTNKATLDMHQRLGFEVLRPVFVPGRVGSLLLCRAPLSQ